ncbi:MAG: hypothetical protein JOZ39_12680 [Chloroflexi bacterium]|nr:hypothetical protein [Chloroflexota bacterium]
MNEARVEEGRATWVLTTRLSAFTPEDVLVEVDVLLARAPGVPVHDWMAYGARATAHVRGDTLFSVVGFASFGGRDALASGVRDEALRRVEQGDWAPDVVYGCRRD